ncbi:hypothetical protein AWB79_00485 [Caballeronia hypogeia]|uniref:Uncharacterized protein n=1 Tax=Caballeronia hypogeia TaxID=1777140 RepID=A0A157Z8A4_9BURK|nr:hypothetical protein AWB79_00485 [Caballeronia hypogeia]
MRSAERTGSMSILARGTLKPEAAAAVKVRRRS